jgi:hypothetical protein
MIAETLVGLALGSQSRFFTCELSCSGALARTCHS